MDNTGNTALTFPGITAAAKILPKTSQGTAPPPATGNRIRNCRSPAAVSYGLYVDGGQHILLTSNTITSCSGGIGIGAGQKAPLTYAASHISVSGNACKNNGKNNAILPLAKCRNVTISGSCFSHNFGGADIRNRILCRKPYCF